MLRAGPGSGDVGSDSLDIAPFMVLNGESTIVEMPGGVASPLHPHGPAAGTPAGAPAAAGGVNNGSPRAGKQRWGAAPQHVQLRPPAGDAGAEQLSGGEGSKGCGPWLRQSWAVRAAQARAPRVCAACLPACCARRAHGAARRLAPVASAAWPHAGSCIPNAARPR